MASQKNTSPLFPAVQRGSEQQKHNGKPWNSNMRIRLEAKLKGFLSFCLVEVILEASTNHQSNDIGVMSWKNS